MKITGIDFVAIPAQDMERAVTFYRDVLGLEQTEAFDGPFVEFKVGTETIAVFDPTKMGQQFQAISTGALALHVEDVDAFRKELEARNVKFLAPTSDSGVCHGAFFLDSEGNALALHHRYAPEGAKKPAAPRAKSARGA